jgi:SAM-dependent methyltransferase
MTATHPPGNYGIDAPRLVIAPALLILVGAIQAILQRTPWPLIGVVLIAGCCLMSWYASRVGKFVVWGRLLDNLDLRGDEKVLESGNGPDATMRNATAAGVSDRVEVHTANITELPFPDDSFDLVISNVVIHNLKTGTERDTAIDEAVRVLRPGGRLLIADLRGTRQYRQRLQRLDLAEVARRDLGWRQWWSGPWLPTHLVSARKPT